MKTFPLCCGVSVLVLILGGGFHAHRAFEMADEARVAIEEAQRISFEKEAIESSRREEVSRLDKLRLESVPFAEAELNVLEQDLQDATVLESEYRHAYEEDKEWTTRHERLSAQHARLLDKKKDIEKQVQEITSALHRNYKSADVEHRLRFERNRVTIRRMKATIQELQERILKLEEAMSASDASDDETDHE